MQIIWQRERCLVSDILKELETQTGVKPPHSTISSIVRILEKKEFVGHKAYGRTYEYFPTVNKEDYSKGTVGKLIRDYFEGSMSNLVSFLVKEQDLSVKELREMLDKLEEE